MDNRVAGTNWSAAEDALLTEAVLTYIAENKSQTQAFEDVGDVIGRTADACGFRWNATLRKKNLDAIEEAKKKRAALRYPKKTVSHVPDIPVSVVDEPFTGKIMLVNEPVAMEEKPLETKKRVFGSTREMYEAVVEVLDGVLDSHLEKDKETDALKAELFNAKARGEALARRVTELENQLAEYEEMKRAFAIARKIMLREVPEDVIGQIFAMEKNGNLNKLEKGAKRNDD